MGTMEIAHIIERKKEGEEEKLGFCILYSIPEYLYHLQDVDGTHAC